MAAIVNALRPRGTNPALRRWLARDRATRAIRLAQAPNPDRRQRRVDSAVVHPLESSPCPTRLTRAAWLFVALALLLFIAFGSTPASAFCGFYVGKADAKLFNEASQVILVARRQSHRDQHAQRLPGRSLRIRAGRSGSGRCFRRARSISAIRRPSERIDAYCAPRLAEYFDPESLREMDPETSAQMGAMNRRSPASMARKNARKDKALGVTVEAQIHRTASTTSRSCRPPSRTASRPG